jgi:hypothetical protein
VDLEAICHLSQLLSLECEQAHAYRSSVYLRMLGWGGVVRGASFNMSASNHHRLGFGPRGPTNGDR